MATQSKSLPGSSRLELQCIGKFPGMRGLAWDGYVLYASRGYQLLRTRPNDGPVIWEMVGHYRSEWWRKLTSTSQLASRFFRDGFHALAVLPTKHLVAAVPKAIITLAPGETEFRVTHRVLHGTRPLHIVTTPDGNLFWGEYFDNAQRGEVHIYASSDHGANWHIAYTFPKGTIRHVHNIVYDEWENCLWVLTGDNGTECRILKFSCNFHNMETVMSGNQQTRAVALVPARDGLYFSSDTPFEPNHIYCLDRQGSLKKVADIGSSSIYGCKAGDAVLFSTMVEPSEVNRDRRVRVYGSAEGSGWQSLAEWSKDRLPMGLFQYGNAFLPDGLNSSGLLAVSTIATVTGDGELSLWRISEEQ